MTFETRKKNVASIIDYVMYTNISEYYNGTSSFNVVNKDILINRFRKDIPHLIADFLEIVRLFSCL